ncbi:hypothetical protein LVY75_27120 [Sinorhizobium sp. B11]
MGKRKKPSKRSDQEKLVAHFASHSISAHAIFHPVQWGNGREPADMIIVAGRTLFFINMTKGKSYFEDLVEHNLKQARDRINEWQAGLAIRGRNEWRTFTVGWDDVDHIAVISVVDGPHAACSDHPLAGLNLPEKVKICTSLTSKVMHEIAALNGSARDILDVCVSLRNEDIFSEEDLAASVSWMVQELRTQFLSQIPRQPTRLGLGIRNGELVSSIDEFIGYLTDVRREPTEGMEVLADVSWENMLAAAAYITKTVADIEWSNDGFVLVSDFGDQTKFRVIVSSASETLAKHMPEIISSGQEMGVAFFYIIQFFHIGPSVTFFFGASPPKLQIEADLEAL